MASSLAARSCMLRSHFVWIYAHDVVVRMLFMSVALNDPHISGDRPDTNRFSSRVREAIARKLGLHVLV